MNNLDFSAEPLFSWYVVLLALSGILMVVLGAVGGGLKVGLRILNVLIGLGFLGYAYYLAFVFEGGTYYLFFKVFILPVAMIVYSVKTMAERSRAKRQPAAQAAAFNPNAPQAPYDPNAPQPPYNPNAPHPGAPVPPAVPPAAPQAAPPQGGSPYQPGLPPQPVADNPYAQPAPPAQPGQPQPPHPVG
ncbi:hypothetical protein [Streptomyces sp. NRRL S-350]|uniref:hypothetical protein n=1 Tax=Streptomyces sp. NRRL S-350 TaxID=1463902 RepID=UPI0006897313|nr:hypothetical protein [Streptomyces sp. NRRL S-350]